MKTAPDEYSCIAVVVELPGDDYEEIVIAPVAELAAPLRLRAAGQLTAVITALRETGLAAGGFRAGLAAQIPCRHDYGHNAIGVNPELQDRILCARRAVREHLGPARLAVTPPARIVYRGHSVDLLGEEWIGSTETSDWRYQVV